MQVHLYDDHLECFLSGIKVAHLERVFCTDKLRRARNVNYKHLIESLVKKPIAFYRSRLREHIIPTEQYQQIWQYLDNKLNAREASKFMAGQEHEWVLVNQRI